MKEVDQAAIVDVGVEVCLLAGGQQIEEPPAVAYGRVGLDRLAVQTCDLQVLQQSVLQRCRSLFRKLDIDGAIEL